VTRARMGALRRKGALLCAALLGAALPALAHKPVIVGTASSFDRPVLVKEPEISYAYYGRLAGQAHFYRIDAKEPFLLFLNILVPDFEPEGQAVPRHDMNVEVWLSNVCVYRATGLDSDWTRFYEKYGRDHYYMGPEFERPAEPGTYLIKVDNAAHAGKYALAIGKKEKFTIFSIIPALFKAWSLDRWFFRKDG
jgi:hypothetical protein